MTWPLSGIWDVTRAFTAERLTLESVLQDLPMVADPPDDNFLNSLFSKGEKINPEF